MEIVKNMKTITLKFGKENINGRDTFFSTVDLLKMAINNVPEKSGLSIEEMSKRLKLMDILKDHSEFDVPNGQFEDRHLMMTKEIQLENADYDNLKSLYKEIKWTVVSKFVVDLYNEFEKQ